MTWKIDYRITNLSSCSVLWLLCPTIHDYVVAYGCEIFSSTPWVAPPISFSNCRYQRSFCCFSNPVHSHTLLEALDWTRWCKLRWVAQTSSSTPLFWNRRGRHRGGTEEPLICRLSWCRRRLQCWDWGLEPCTSCVPHLEAVSWLCRRLRSAWEEDVVFGVSLGVETFEMIWKWWELKLSWELPLLCFIVSTF